MKMTRDVMKPSAAVSLWHSVWRLAAPFGEGRRIWRALAMIAAVEVSPSSSKSSGRAARAGDLVVLGPALDPRVRVVLAAAVKLTLVAGENLTVGSTVWLPAESVAPGR
jgi:hypothetical protein